MHFCSSEVVAACSCAHCAAGDCALSAWNVPRHDHRHHLQARELLTQAGLLVHDLVQALTNFYSHSAQRIGVFADAVGEDVSDVNKKVDCFYTVQVLNTVQSFVDYMAYRITVLLAISQTRDYDARPYIQG